MSLKVFRTTRQIRKAEHVLGLHKPGTLSVYKLLSRRRDRRRVRRELRHDTELD